MSQDENTRKSPQQIWNFAFDDATETIKVSLANPLFSSAFDIESKKFIDDQGAGTSVEFMRHYIYNQSDGSIDSVYDTDFAGASYTVVGTAKIAENLDIEKRCLQDSNSSRFIRHYIFDESNGNFLRSYDTDLDGNAFTPVGAVSECPPGFNRFDLISCERVTVNDSSISTLTVPVGAVYSELQVKQGEMLFTIDGTDPTNTGTIGYQISEKGFVKLGEGDSDNASSVDEMFDAKFIALAGDTCLMEVCYWRII